MAKIKDMYDTVLEDLQRTYFKKDNDDIFEDKSKLGKEIKEAYDPRDTEAKFREKLAAMDSRWNDVSDAHLIKIREAIDMGMETPTRFSESKPERVVDLFKEVKYILVPKREEATVNRIVKGTPLE